MRVNDDRLVCPSIRSISMLFWAHAIGASLRSGHPLLVSTEWFATECGVVPYDDLGLKLPIMRISSLTRLSIIQLRELNIRIALHC